MDSPEYKALTQCYLTLEVCIQQSPDDVTSHLRASGILAPGDILFLSNPQHNDDEKARKILNAVLNQVKIDSKVFHKFVSAMKAAGPWTSSAVELLEQAHLNGRQNRTDPSSRDGKSDNDSTSSLFQCCGCFCSRRQKRGQQAVSQDTNDDPLPIHQTDSSDSPPVFRHFHLDLMRLSSSPDI